MDPIVLIPIFALFLVGMIASHVIRERHNLKCPHKEIDAQVDLQRPSFPPAAPLRIKRCNLLADPEKIDCDQECLKLTA